MYNRINENAAVSGFEKLMGMFLMHGIFGGGGFGGHMMRMLRFSNFKGIR